jgi:hypothetical protein
MAASNLRNTLGSSTIAIKWGVHHQDKDNALPDLGLLAKVERSRYIEER